MKDKLSEIKYKTIEFINQQKILSAVIGLTFIMTITIIVLSVTQKNEKRITISPVNTTHSTDSQPKSTTKTTLSPLEIKPNKKITNNSSQPANWQQYANSLIQPTNTKSVINTTIPNKTTPSSKATQSSSGNTSSGAQPTNPPGPILYAAPDSNPVSVPSSSGPQIIFIDSNGQQQTYTPPTNPPVQITWAKYTNQLEKYSIDYPSNWQIVTTQYRGHEAVFIYSPGADPADPNVQYISYGWSGYFYPPAANYVNTFTQDGITGTIYTNGSMGSSFIKGVFQYYNGFLVLNNNVSDEVFTYILNHMILSLDFNTP